MSLFEDNYEYDVIDLLCDPNSSITDETWKSALDLLMEEDDWYNYMSNVWTEEDEYYKELSREVDESQNYLVPKESTEFDRETSLLKKRKKFVHNQVYKKTNGQKREKKWKKYREKNRQKNTNKNF
jgi:putative protein kinase ArgK-like GTPase of G3E family